MHLSVQVAVTCLFPRMKHIKQSKAISLDHASNFEWNYASATLRKDNADIMSQNNAIEAKLVQMTSFFFCILYK